ncbi:MAG: metal-dependent transcriptional regulator [Chloroflexi bacterium]|nr:metal-dependent transcriptional regulator [Chloroflexota bacterium]
MDGKNAAIEPRLTQAAENYLLSIYMVQEQGLAVTNANLVDQLKRTPESEGLGTSLPSIAGMLRRMEREGLITHASNREIELTVEGVRLAEQMVRRHRLAERMVVDMLGLDLVKAHAEAHRLEHAISDELEARIRTTLKNPKTCPFGHPIPGSGYSPCPASSTIDEAPVGQPLRVDRIPEEDSDLLEYLVSNGLVPGVEVEILEYAPYRGVVTLKTADAFPVLGADVVSRIWVCPLNCGADCATRSL